VAVLSIQSSVVYGAVGNRAAGLLLPRLGVEVWPLDTVRFSNHPGHRTVRGRITPAAELAALLEGLAELGVLGECEAVLSGYLGAPETAGVVLDAVRRVRAARPGALYCCDPVMGDAGKPLYVAPSLPARFRDELVPAADVVTPNAVELGHLTGRVVGSEAEALAAARLLCRRGPRLVVVTGLPAGGGRLATLAVDAEAAWVARTARRDRPAHGAGDALTAVFLAAYLEARDARRALARAVGAMEAIFDTPAPPGGRDLPVGAAADRIAALPEAGVEPLG